MEGRPDGSLGRDLFTSGPVPRVCCSSILGLRLRWYMELLPNTSRPLLISTAPSPFPRYPYLVAGVGGGPAATPGRSRRRRPLGHLQAILRRAGVDGQEVLCRPHLMKWVVPAGA